MENRRESHEDRAKAGARRLEMARAKDIRWKGKFVKGVTTALADASEHLTGWARMWMSESVRDAILQIDSQWPHTTTVGNSIMRTKKRNSMDWILVSAHKFGGDRVHPWYSGQLHDSVVGVVSDRRRIISAHYMPSHATAPQTDDNGNVVDGSALAMSSIGAISRTLRFVPGVSASIFVTVPYAEKVNRMPRHLDFEWELSSDFAAIVEDFFYTRAEGYRTRIFRVK